MQLWVFLFGTVACVALSGATPLAEVKEASEELLDHHEIHKRQLKCIYGKTPASLSGTIEQTLVQWLPGVLPPPTPPSHPYLLHDSQANAKSCRDIKD